MDEREMVDVLYGLWSKATAGEWALCEDGNLMSTDSTGWENYVAFTVSEDDAAFMSAVHSAMPELVKRYHAALDEAEGKDYAQDSLMCRIAELEIEVADLKDDLAGLVG